MQRKFITLGIVLIILEFASALMLNAQSSGFQLRVGAANPYSEERIDIHGEYGFGISKRLSQKFVLRLDGSYYQYKHYWNQHDFEYRGTVYTCRNAQLWRDHGLDITGAVYPYKHLYFGVGVGVDRIYVKRILYRDYSPFWVDLNDDVHAISQEEEKTKYCFSLGSVLGLEQPLWKKLALLIEGRYKLLFAEPSLTDTDSANVSAVSVWVGIKYGF